MLCSASRVGAYALMRVANRFCARGMRHVISLSLMPIGDSGMRCSSLDFTAKPTPWLRREPLGTPFQKKVYLAPASVRESSPCSLVSLRAMLYRCYTLRAPGLPVLSCGGACRDFQPGPIVCERSTKQCLTYFSL